MASAGGNRPVYLAAAIVSIGGLLFGYDLLVASGAILFIKQDMALSPGREEWVLSAALLGAALGAGLAGTASDRFGRRSVLFVTALAFVIGAVGTALAPSSAWLITGRTVTGIGIGMGSVTVPLYISEISPVEIRGQLVSINTLAGATGAILAFVVGFAFSDHGAWRWMFGLGVVPGVALALGLLRVSETPRWLVSHDRHDQGRRVLERLRGRDDVEQELASIAGATSRASWSELLGPAVRPALLVGTGLAVLQRVTGVNVGLVYGPTVLEAAGFGSASVDMLASIAIGVVLLVATLIGMRLVDRKGRRPLLVFGFAAMCLALVTLGLTFSFMPSGARWLALGSILLLVGAWMIGPGMVVFLLLSEIYPTRVRGLAMSVSIVALWGSFLVVSMTLLSLIDWLGRPLTFWLFGGLCVVALIFVLRFAPETRGRSLEDIEASWHRGAASG